MVTRSSVTRRGPVRRRRDRDQGGAIVVEFALIVPLLLLLVFGILEFGFMMNRDTAIDNATRDGARVASLDGTFADICTSITGELAGSGIPVAATTPCNTTQTTNATIRIDCIKPDASKTPCAASTSQTAYDILAASGATATVKVTYTHRWITPLISSVLGSTIVLEQTTQMKVE